MSDVAVIVLAAGSGSRIGSAKQFLELTRGRTLVDAAVETALSVTAHVVVVLPEGRSWDGADVESHVAGGTTRVASVARGLDAVPAEIRVVLVHDAAHPLAPQTIFLDAIEAVRGGADAAVPLLEASDVIKRRQGEMLRTVGRDGMGLAQVPMGFDHGRLRYAHDRLEQNESTVYEDSELIEREGGSVVPIQSSPFNIHVVTSQDLDLARMIARARGAIG